MKSARNKTIDFPLEEGKKYLENCITEKHLSEKEGYLPLNKTVIGDVFNVLKMLPDKCADLIIVDPPYNLDKSFHGANFKKTDMATYAEYTEKWIKAVACKLKDNGSIYICCDWKSSIAIAPLINNYFILRNRITWEREKGRGAKKNWKNSMEDIFFATAGEDYKFNLGAVKVRKKVLAPYKDGGNPKDWEKTDEGNYRNTCPSNFWDDISVPYWSMAENTAHPTQKPEKLMAKLILASSDKGDIVLDPFAGSGTTGVVAKKLGRNFINIEKNPLYCAWAEKRLAIAEKDKEIQGYRDGIFWERNSRPCKNHDS